MNTHHETHTVKSPYTDGLLPISWLQSCLLHFSYDWHYPSLKTKTQLESKDCFSKTLYRNKIEQEINSKTTKAENTLWLRVHTMCRVHILLALFKLLDSRRAFSISPTMRIARSWKQKSSYHPKGWFWKTLNGNNFKNKQTKNIIRTDPAIVNTHHEFHLQRIP